MIMERWLILSVLVIWLGMMLDLLPILADGFVNRSRIPILVEWVGLAVTVIALVRGPMLGNGELLAYGLGLVCIGLCLDIIHEELAGLGGRRMYPMAIIFVGVAAALTIGCIMGG